MAVSRRAVVTGAVVAILVGQWLAGGVALDRLIEDETYALGYERGASLADVTFAVRAAHVVGGEVQYRLSESDPFVVAPPGYGGHFPVPAAKVDPRAPFRLQLRYANVLGQLRTPWLVVDPRRALVRSRQAMLEKGAPCARVVTPPESPRLELRFFETTDEVAEVRYALDGGPFVRLPERHASVPLGSVPRTIVVRVALLDGSVWEHAFEQGAFTRRHVPAPSG